MASVTYTLKYHQKTGQFEEDNKILLVQNIQLHKIDQILVNCYNNGHLYHYLICPIEMISQTDQKDNHSIIVCKWGYQMSTLSQYQIQSYVKESWLLTVLTAFVGMSVFLPKINKNGVYIENNEEPKFLPTQCCSKEEYLTNFKVLGKEIFKHLHSIVDKCDKIKNLEDIVRWLNQIQHKKEAKTINKLIQLKALQPKGKSHHKIQLNEEQRQWVLSYTGYTVKNKMDLVYQGDKCNFDPAPLLQIANKQQLLFVLQTTQSKRVVFWMAAKPQINSSSLFGTYYSDHTKKSVLLGLERRSVHFIQDEGNSVGFGNELLLTIGRTDVVLSAFNCTNVSYFPCSYASDDSKGVKKAEDLMGREFVLRQLQVYRIN